MLSLENEAVRLERAPSIWRMPPVKRIHSLLRSPRPVKWLFYGDSITHGAFHTLGWRDYTELFSERIRYELGRSDDVVIKTAYNGNTTRHLLESFQWRVKQFRPQVVFVMVGTNDCCLEPSGVRVPLDEFKSNLKKLIEIISALDGALPILQTTCPLLPGGAPEREPYLEKYMAAVRSMARETRVPLIDHRAYWMQKTKMSSGRLYFWMSDAIHPNEMGHRVFSELIFKKLKIHNSDSTTCRLFYP